MRVGFTGSRHGMTDLQFAAFVFVLPDGVTLFRHGCCLGADEQAALHVSGMVPRPTVFAHFSDLPEWTSEKAAAVCDDCAQPEQPLDRNRDIVDGSDVLIAAPSGPEKDNPRSGTWATIRYATKQRKKVILIWPDGSIDG
jgi:hypothetical protein